MIDVKTHDVEPPGLIADRIRRALGVIPAERLIINPDCGLRPPAARRRVQQTERHGRRGPHGP